MAGASIETTLELWASLLRDVKAKEKRNCNASKSPVLSRSPGKRLISCHSLALADLDFFALSADASVTSRRGLALSPTCLIRGKVVSPEGDAAIKLANIANAPEPLRHRRALWSESF